MLADVDAGSDTPSLASKVLKWRKESGVQGDFFLYHYRMEIKPLTYLYLADILWREIDQLNQSFAQILLHITKLHNDDPDNYGAAVKYLSSLQPIQVRKCSASSSDRSHHLTWDALFSSVGG